MPKAYSRWICVSVLCVLSRLGNRGMSAVRAHRVALDPIEIKMSEPACRFLRVPVQGADAIATPRERLGRLGPYAAHCANDQHSIVICHTILTYPGVPL